MTPPESSEDLVVRQELPLEKRVDFLDDVYAVDPALRQQIEASLAPKPDAREPLGPTVFDDPASQS